MGFSYTKAAASMTAGSATTASGITIRDVVQIDDRFARIIAVASVNAKPEEVADGLKKKLCNVTPIPGSFMSIASDAHKHIFEGIVGIVQQRVVATPENRGKFTAVAGNMFNLDGDLWALRKTATGDVFVKSVAEDDSAIMHALLACATTDRNDFAHQDAGQQSANIRASVANGTLISYISQESSDLQMGIAVSAIDYADGTDTHTMAVVRPNGHSEIVNREMIVAISGDNPDDGAENLAVASTADYNLFASYYARVFARRPAYFEEFMKRVRAHKFF